MLLPLLAVPWAIPLIRDIYTKQGAPLNMTLAGTGKLELLYGIGYSLGYVLDKLL